MSKIGRNAPCPCGSGKKYKKCCINGKKRQGKKPKAHLVPVYTDIDQLSNSVVDLIKEKKWDEAETVCKQLMVEYPDQIDGFFRWAQVYEARGDKKNAAKYYRKSAKFAEVNEGFDQDGINWYYDQAKRMEE